MILRRRTNHRRPADVDVLDRLRKVAAASRDLREGVEIHADEVDRLDAVSLHLLPMGIHATTPENPAVDPRVECFYAPVENFRRPGVLAHVGHRDAGGTQCARRATRRKNLRAELGKSASEIDDPRLVTDAEKRPLDRAAQGHLLPRFVFRAA